MEPSVFSKENFDKLSTDEKVDIFVEAYRVPRGRSKAEVLESLRGKMGQPVAQEKPGRSLKVYWSVAASVAVIVLLTTFYFYQPAPKQVIAARGQHLEFTLPDGSGVTVNADSKIVFSEARFAQKRTLKLEGEAFFSVRKGTPFVVKTPMGTVEVLGTSLNVYSRGNDFSVSCLTGKVQVTVDQQSLIVEPGERAELVSGSLQKTSNISTNHMAGWRSGEYHFEKVPLISIFDEIERQFNVDISSEGIGARLYSGPLSNKDLNEALEMLSLTMDLEYEIKEQKIRIQSKK